MGSLIVLHRGMRLHSISACRRLLIRGCRLFDAPLISAHSPEGLNGHLPVHRNLHRLSFRLQGGFRLELGNHRPGQDRVDRGGIGRIGGISRVSAAISRIRSRSAARLPLRAASPSRWQGCTKTVRLAFLCGMRQHPLRRLQIRRTGRESDLRTADNGSIGSLIRWFPGQSEGGRQAVQPGRIHFSAPACGGAHGEPTHRINPTSTFLSCKKRFLFGHSSTQAWVRPA